MTESDKETNNQAESEKPTVSQFLVAGREKLGITQPEIAKKLFLTLTFIKYLEEGEFDLFPNQAYIKGYLRSYARAININGAEVVAMYEADTGRLNLQPGLWEGNEGVDSASFGGPVLKSAIVGLVLIILVIAVVWILSKGEQAIPASPESASSETPASVQVETPLPEPVTTDTLIPDALSTDTLSADTLSADTSSTDTSSTNAISTDTDTRVIEPGGIDVEQDAVDDINAVPVAADNQEETGDLEEIGDPEIPDEIEVRETDNGALSIERTETDDYRYINVDAGGFEQLEFTFADECWVEIEHGKGTAIYGDLNRGGDILTVYGIAPFNILLGSATSVTLKLNREEVDLSEYTNSDQTAKFELGG